MANDSEEMAEMRRQHRAQRVIGGVPWEMVLNFDQLWRSGYEPPPKVLHKRRAREADRQEEEWGECRPSDLVGKRLQAVLATVEGEMKKRTGQTNKSALRRAPPRSEYVQGGRIGVTAVTSTWASGELGPLGVCVASGAVPLSFIQDINKQWAGHIYVFESGSDSHFMNAETTLLYLQELIGPATLPNHSYQASPMDRRYSRIKSNRSRRIMNVTGNHIEEIPCCKGSLVI